MIVSVSHNYIFIRVPKNGSTSLAEWFITNFTELLDDMWTRVNDAKINDTNVPHWYVDRHKKDYHFIHTTLQEIHDAGLVLPETFANMNKIAVIRNPLERQLSLFFFKGGKTPEEFRSTFKNGYHPNDVSNKIRQIDYLKVNGEIDPKACFWCYDYINEITELYRDHLKSEKHVTQLGNFKTQFTPKKDSLLSDYYDKYTRDAVLDYYSEDYEKYLELKEAGVPKRIPVII